MILYCSSLAGVCLKLIVRSEVRVVNLHYQLFVLVAFFSFECHLHCRWAVSTVITRQNKIPSTTGEPTLALIPMWDLCNHCNGTV